MDKREIKFRFLHNSGIGWGYVILPNIDGADLAHFNKSTIGQYIGFKDKKGEEIYGDDLLKHNGKIYKVIWTAGGFGIVNIKNMMDAGCLHDIDLREVKNPDGFEIVGNIYENPELLMKDLKGSALIKEASKRLK